MESKKKETPLALSDLVNVAIDDLGIRDDIDEAQAIKVWHDLAGPVIAKVTERVWTRRGRMYVELNSGTWRQELHMHRVQWRDRLNEALGKRIIHEIIFQ
ncbi:MAG: DUF721 domain-containing protein [Rhodothermaceae bacterium]|nr:DUF721 domain-containing protein [Rhodothermaceae bacterium]MYG69219.1 DUF721 domain-containing protein [Rhodothermaceae bacterium]MYJ45656.1 DUF721 domain-containing protein [Rhodothermaceae bacterium]